jgi:glycosyltransferase involved in cell wall biosynthesis
MTGFSIIICTYNPNEVTFQRLLLALSQFRKTNFPYEIVLVDNNSTPSISERDIVKQFSTSVDDIQVICEKNPGLTAARVTGIVRTIYDWVIFFDDDNEPAEDYLLQIKLLIEKYPQVGAWGPGKITVNYINQIETAFLKKIKWLFQERQYEGTFFEKNIVEGSEYYPFGTGMVVRKDVLLEYVSRVNAGRYTMSDRKGKSLMSAGDIQILFTCLQRGYFAGSSNILKLTHIIDISKANPKYAARLVYALNSSQLKAYQEVFTDQKLETNRITNNDVLKVVYSALRLYSLNSINYTRKMYLCKRLGELNARVIASDLKPPYLLSLFERVIHS